MLGEGLPTDFYRPEPGWRFRLGQETFGEQWQETFGEQWQETFGEQW